MPIFKDELLSSIPKETEKLKAYLGSIEPLPIATPSASPNLFSFGQTDVPKNPMTIDQLSKIRADMSTGFAAPTSSISGKELYENSRYPMYERGLDLENVYGHAQSWYSALGSGIAKAGVRALGTFAQSFASIPNTIDAIRKGDISELSGDVDGFEGTIDNWVENFENWLPNYYTRREQDSPWIASIPFAPGSANFWGDKVIKNLGFTAGAIAGAVAQDAIIGAVTGGVGVAPAIAGQVGRLSLALNKLFSVANKAEDIVSYAAKVGVTGKNLLTLEKAYGAAKLIKLGNGARYATSIYGSSLTEAGVEAREGYRGIKEALIEQYKQENGVAPVGQDLLEIEKYATNGMNTRFGINMALLTVSNAVMFGNMFKSLGRADKIVASKYTRDIADAGKIGMVEGSIDQFERKVAQGFGNKVWDFAKPKLPTIFSEGAYEEGGQFAAETGTFDYYTRKYRNLNNPANAKAWNSLEEVIDSTVQGLSEQFGTEEGLQNMYLGAISALIMGGATGLIDKARGQGKDARLSKSLEILNKNLMTGIFQDKYNDTATSIAIANDMQEAAKTGDVFKYKNLQNELLFNFVHTRSKAGMHDVTIDQLEMLKDLSEEEFTKQFGIDFTAENQKTVVGYVDALIDRANKIDADIRQINDIYINPFEFIENPDTPEEHNQKMMHIVFESWKTEVAQMKSSLYNFENRAQEISDKVAAKFEGLNNATLISATSKKGLNALSEEYTEQANLLQNTISTETHARERASTRKEIQLLRSLASKANILANRAGLEQELNEEYVQDILSFENNFRDASSTKRISKEDALELRHDADQLNKGEKARENVGKKLVALTSKKGMMKYMAQEKEAQEQVAPEEMGGINYVNDEKEVTPLEVGRDYEIDEADSVSYKKLDDGRYEVKLPSGELIHTKTEAQAKTEVDIANQALSNMKKVKVLALNENGTVTIEDSTGTIYDIAPERLKGYKRLATMQEKLLKKQEELKKIQKGIQTKSGSIPTIPTPDDLPFHGEGKIKPTDILYTSTTTDSVDFAEQQGRTLDPHITRSFTFLENVDNFENRNNIQAMLVNSRNEESLGLSGLSEMSDPTVSLEENKANVTGGFMAQVYIIEEDGKQFYISETGEKLTEVGEPADLSKIVFQTMPTTETVWPSTGKPRYRHGEQEEAELQAARYAAFRREYYESDNVITLPFSVSRGIANEGPEGFRTYVSDVFISEDKIRTQQGLVHIATTDSVVFQGQTLKVPSGVPMIVYKDKLEYLRNRTFDKKEAQTIYTVLKEFAKELVKRAEDAKGGKISRISEYSDFIQNIMYWKSKLDTKDKVSDNQIYVNLKEMSIDIGAESYPIDTFETHRDAIITHLQKVYSSVNNHTLTKNFNEPFTEFYLDDKKGEELQTREWENYQTYLLSSKNPDGSKRPVGATPLTTNILPATDAIPYSFKQKYSTLIGLDFPQVKRPPATKKSKGVVTSTDSDGTKSVTIVTKDDDGKERKIVAKLDGKTPYESTAITKYGVVKVVASEDANGTVRASVSDDNASLAWVAEIADDAGIVEQALQRMGKAYVADEKTTNDDIIIAYIELVETARLRYFMAGDTQKGGTQQDSGDGAPSQNAPEWTKGEILTKEDLMEDAVSGEILDMPDNTLLSLTVENVIQTDENGVRTNVRVVTKDPTTGEENSFVVPLNLKPKESSVAVPPTTPPSTNNIPGQQKFKPNNTSGLGPAFRLQGEESSTKEGITEEELVIFQEWMAENLPQIPYEIVENVIRTHTGEKAWGSFSNGLIKFVRGGLKGTQYHEAFEAVWNSMLSEEQQTDILNEFKNRRGVFLDRVSNEYIPYIEATDLQAKERIADDFAEFKTGQLPARSIGELLRRFFRAIIDFAVSFFDGNLQKDLFKAIDSGKFKNVQPKPFLDTAYAAVTGLTDVQTHEFIQDMTGIISFYINSRKQDLFNPSEKSSKELFEMVEAIYNDPATSVNGLTKRETIGDEAWNELVKRVKDNLRVLKVNFDDSDATDINEENANKNEYADNPFTVDARKSSTWPVKFTLATLFQTDASPGRYLSANLPKFKLSSVGGVLLMNFSRTFATVLDRLSNSSTPKIAVDRLVDLATSDPNYVRLLTKLGGELKEGSNRRVTAHFPFDKFDKYDWRLFVQFVQTFTRQHPSAIVQYKNKGEIYSNSINEYAAARDLKKSWIDRIKILVEDNDRLVFYDKVAKLYKTRPFQSTVFEASQGVFHVTTPYGGKRTFTNAQEADRYAKDHGISIRSRADSVKFLNDIGISYSIETVNKMDDNDKKRFMESVATLFRYLDKKSELMTLSEKTLDINGPLDVLSTLAVKVDNPNKENTHYGVDGKRRGDYSESNAVSVLEDDFNDASTIEDLLEVRPELQDLFSEGSLILKKGGKFADKDGKIKRRIKVEYIQGTKDITENESFTTNELNIGERYAQEINQNLLGKYYVIVPADSSTEWMINFGHFFDYKEINTENKKWKNILPAFRDYLMDDIRLALDYENREYIKNVKDRGARELRFFKDILDGTDMLTKIDEMIMDNQPYETIEEYVDANQETLQEAVKELISMMSENTIQTLKDNEQIVRTGTSAENFIYRNIDTSVATKFDIDPRNMSETQLKSVMDFAIINQVIANIEMHKLLFGDPYQFKSKDGILDETKRIKSFLSPRKKMFQMDEYDTFLNQEFNKANKIALQKGEMGHHEFKPYANVTTYRDQKIAGSLSNIMGVYGHTSETDGFSWMRDVTFREVMMKNGQWHDDAEAWHQWQMAYTRQNMPGYKYVDPALIIHDQDLLRTKPPKYTLKVLKPIVSGTAYNSKAIKLNLHKFAQMPVYYSMVEGTNMEKQYIKMANENVDYTIVDSGVKVGVTDTHDIYNNDGTFNETPYNNSEKVSWKSYGIQVETESDSNKFQTRGSQLTKMASMDLFRNGTAISEKAAKAYARNTEILEKLHQNAYDNLLKKLGIEEDGEDNYVLTNGKVLSETLLSEMLRREASDNLKDALTLDENDQFKIPFEAAPSYINIRDIIYAMVNKALVSPKMGGGAHVQVPSTMFESATEGRKLLYKKDDVWEEISRDTYEALSDKEKKKVMLGDNNLKFYKNKDGERYMEIMVPHWFKNAFGKNMSDEKIMNILNKSPEGQKILKGIGFRIPTQALSSVDVFKVKGFLPQYMGATVVVPSEITTKTGSDFDIDKLNMYLKSVYRDAEGIVKLIELKGNEEQTRDYYGKQFDYILAQEILNKRQLLQGLEEKALKEDELIEDVFDVEMETETGEQSAIAMLLDMILGEDLRTVQVKEDIRKLNDADLQAYLKDKFINSMYTKALENEYYDSLEELITLEENFERHITPVGDGGLEALSEELDKLRNIDEGSVKNKLIDRNYLTNLRGQFILAKRWIGIAAVNITNLSLRQKAGIYLDVSRISKLTPYERKYLGSGEIQIPHNTIEVNGEERVSISGIRTEDNSEYISERLSGFATATVDVANKPYILKVFSSDLLINPYMFLESIGAGRRGIMFLNQPIIQEYVKMLDRRNIKELYNEANITEILSKFPESTTFNTRDRIDMDSLEENIKAYSDENGNFKNSGNKELNNQQRLILYEFLKYSKLGTNMFHLSQATNYDTTRFRNGEELMRKQIQTEIASEKNLFSSVDDILGNTFVGPQEYYIDKAIKALNTVFKLDDRTLKSVSDKLIRPYAENSFTTKDDYAKIVQDVKIGLLDYILQTGRNIDGNRIQEMLIDADTSLAKRLEDLKEKYGDGKYVDEQGRQYPQVQILNELSVVSAKQHEGFKTIKLNANIKEAYDENYYTGLMRELRDTSEETNKFYYDLIDAAIVQGTKRSAVSIKNIIPIEDYGETVKDIIDNAPGRMTMEIFTKGMFHRNHFKQDELVPVYQPRFQALNTDSFGDALVQGVRADGFGDVRLYTSPQFPSIPALGIKSNQRQILLINERYDSKYTSNDFIKISRTVRSKVYNKVSEEMDTVYIDLENGQNIPFDLVKHNREKGDYSLFMYYGYAKVKLPDGSPVTYQTEKGVHHVYKLVNLYGEGILGKEYYKTFERSRADNNTYKIKEELDDNAIADYYGSVSPITIDTQSSPALITRLSERAFVGRTTVQNNRDVLYLFGDNNAREGLGGTAKEMRGEPNAIGISTKRLPARTEEAYMTDEQLETNKEIITQDINDAIAEWNTGNYERTVITAIGEGLSELLSRAPRTYEHLQAELERFQKTVASSRESFTESDDVNSRIILRPYSELVNMPVFVGNNVNTMRKPGYYHFGNPFSGTFNRPGLFTIFDRNGKLDTNEARNMASQAYFDWLEGTRYTDIKQTQRRYILAKIDQGLLDNAKFYYMDNRGGYTSHAEKLIEFVEKRRGLKVNESQVKKEEENSISLPKETDLTDNWQEEDNNDDTCDIPF